MPYRAALNDFNRKNRYEINSKRIEHYITSAVKNSGHMPAKADENIGSRIKNNFFVEDVKRYEQIRQQMIMKSIAKPNDKKLQAAVNEMADPANFIVGYISVCREIARAAAHRDRGNKYEPSKYFGFKSQDVTEMAMMQANSFTYKQAREYELFEAYSIKDKRFTEQASVLEGMITSGKTYDTAEAAEKDEIHKTYITNELVKKRLKTKTGFWKLFHRAETKAMKNYIAKADSLLKGLNFPEKAPKAVETFAGQSYLMMDPAQRQNFMQRVQTLGNTVTEASTGSKETQAKAPNAQATAEQVKNKRAKLETDVIKNEVTAANSKDINDALYEIRFRPSFDKEVFDKQFAACKMVGSKTTKAAPRALREVLYYNSQKLAKVKHYFEQSGNLSEEEREKKQNELVIDFIKDERNIKAIAKERNGGKEYVPMTFEEVKNLESKKLQEQLEKDLNKESAPKEKPVSVDKEQPVTTKEHVKNN